MHVDMEESGASAPSASDTPVTPSRVAVDFLYLDLNTCERCVATGDTLDAALAVLAPVFRTVGAEVSLNRVNIATRELAQRYQFVSSPTIRVNGVDICTELKESLCGDCSDLSGCSTNCRVFVWEGREYEQPPVGMIVDGILGVWYGKPAVPAPRPYSMPDNLIDFFNGRKPMKTIRVFEPALCCNTGVCGPDPAQELVVFTADLHHIKRLGVDATRYNLATNPTAFAESEPVRQFLQTAGSEGLPLTLVDGAVALTGRYPSRAELLRYAGIETSAPASAGCCGGDAQVDDAASTGCCGGDAQVDAAASSSGCCGGDVPVDAPAAPASGCCGGSECC